MISEKDTNKIYLSGLLESRFPRVFSEIISVLDNFGLKANPLPDTRDIWARDYMPIQISTDKFIEFRYDPDYLQGTDKGRRDLKTYPEMVCAKLGLKTEISDLILDGGNVVRSTNCIILTDKVVKENRHTYSKPELISKLQKTFEVDKVVLIPWDTLEKYGHADGMVRFIDNKTVLVNKNYKKNTVLIYRLESSGLKCKFLNYKVKKQNKNNWAYINFLQTKDLILLPKLGAEEDDQALKQISDFFPDYADKNRIIQIEMNDIIALGGALNCISWTIKE
jgi:agmatine/peptidylarginine deiminase